MPTEAELLAARQAGYLTPAGQNLIRDGDDAISQNAVTAHQAAAAARYDRGVFPLNGNMTTLPPGAYDVPTYAVAITAQPAFPAEACAAGTLIIAPGTTYRSVEFVPIGVTLRPKPVWRNEFNKNLDPQWYGWHRVDAASLKPAPPNTTLITILGDSQSAASVAGTWPGVADPLITQSFYNQARSGDDSNAVGIRAGWVRPLVTVTGGVIPASGSVTVTTNERLQLRADRVLVTGTIAGVAGSLRHDSAGSFTFTRDTPGSATPVAGPTRFESSFTTAAAVVIVWMGGNDLSEGTIGASSTVADHIVSGYRAAVDWAKPGQTVVVAGVTNRRDAGPGTAGFAQSQEVNRRLRETYPARFLDVQGYLSQHAIYDAGLTPTAADLEAMSREAIPPALFLADGVHLTTAAHQALGAKRIAPWLTARGYATPDGTLPDPAPITPKPAVPIIAYDTDGVPYLTGA